MGSPRIQYPTDVLIQVEGAAVCGTDLHILEVPPRHPATPGVILGHEFAGRIAEVGSAVAKVKVGDPVAVDPNAPCGHCEMCLNSFPNACTTIKSAPVPGYFNTRGIFRDGAMARYIVYPATDVYKIARHIPAAHAAMSEPLAAVLNGLNKIGIFPGETMVVLGAGPIGLLFLEMAKAGGARVIVSEPPVYCCFTNRSDSSAWATLASPTAKLAFASSSLRKAVFRSSWIDWTVFRSAASISSMTLLAFLTLLFVLKPVNTSQFRIIPAVQLARSASKSRSGASR